MEFGTFLVASTIYLLAWFLVRKWLRHRRLPPGAKLPPMPPTSSILGHVELNQPDFHRKKALEWASQYGPVFRLRQYFTDVVVINDRESMKKFCCKNQLLERPKIMTFGSDHYEGLARQSGDIWMANKTFFLRVRRDLGFGTPMEKRIEDVFHHLSERIDAAKEAPLLVQDYVLDSLVNITASLVYGAAMMSDIKLGYQLSSLYKRVRQVLQKGISYKFWPRLLLKLSMYLPFTWNWEMKAAVDAVEDFTDKQIKKYLAATPEKPDRDFIRTYLQKIEESNGDLNTAFEYRYLVGNANSVILGGIFNPTRALVGHMVMCAARRHAIQDRIQQEIDAVIGATRTPTWEDRKKMPFTMACIWEMERWNVESGFNLPRTSDHDLLVDDLFIPKGTVVFLNLWAISNNPSVWKNPCLFDPTRFLMEDGTLISKKPEDHVAFSVGKRSCPGEPFAIMEIFLLLTLILQKYHVLLGQPLDFDPQDNNFPHNTLERVKLRFVQRRALRS
ncbi:cytochrome P450 2H2-like [Amblyomma americanum]